MRLDLLVPQPGCALVESAAELGPAVQQPLAAGRRGFEPEDDGLGMVADVEAAVVRRAGPRRDQHVEQIVPKGDIPGRIAVAEEPVAEGGDHFMLTIRLRDRDGSDDAGELGHLGALGPVQLPGGVHGLLDQELLDVVLGLKVGDPGLDPHLKDVGILVGQDEGLGGHAVLDGVEPGPVLAIMRAWARALLSVAAVDRGSIDRGGGRGGHGGLSRDWMP